MNVLFLVVRNSYMPSDLETERRRVAKRSRNALDD